MSQKLPSARFSRLLESLPEDARQALIQKHILPLLNHVPKDKCLKILAAAARQKSHFKGMPQLDLKSKEDEVNGLLDELEKDIKRSLVKDKTNREELLSETVDSLVDWLNDIWSVSYEFGANFWAAHACLLFNAGVLYRLANSRGGCKCFFMNMYVSVVIKKRSGKPVKSFSLSGAHNLEEPLLWIWRDLLLNILHKGSEKQKNRIPEMLVDIESILGWRGLERMLYGGKQSRLDTEDSEENQKWSYLESDDDELEDDSCYVCGFHSDHWSDEINDLMIPLRKLVEEQLISVFKVSPSCNLWQSIRTISPDPEKAEINLTSIIASIATNSSDTFAAALEIYTLENQTYTLVSLLDSHFHLLRSRDAQPLQAAVATISRNPCFQTRALQMLEKELLDSARIIQAAVRTCFSQINDPTKTQELEQVLKLRHQSESRRDRVESWVDSVIAPGIAAPNPLVFAAMMIGIPLGGTDNDDADPLGYLDLDPNDPDLEDLREEFRPKLKDRFETWIMAAAEIKGGSTVLPRVYKEIVALLPCLRGTDVVDEMIQRLVDKASKHHICDALEALSRFVKMQRKKMAQLADSNKKKRQATSTRIITLNAPSSSTTPPPAIPPQGGGIG
ncbi:hypothetical protein JAAARDRAFT_73311 [Jaapia argillacea MUCL 33604]|uniref:Uncharacterized protein n=1 Tax=Jaapia argillacea MUCL 33604 TaxID=933084 RepID=A0A067PDX3_9AGAM|nr:hypothetical protein JAAARDRAFT_73311 [Jaapia argillacea MUCL 33604]